MLKGLNGIAILCLWFSAKTLVGQSLPPLSQVEARAMTKSAKNLVKAWGISLELTIDKDIPQMEKELIILSALTAYFESDSVKVFDRLNPSLDQRGYFSIKTYYGTLISWFPDGATIDFDSLTTSPIYVAQKIEEPSYFFLLIKTNRFLKGKSNQGEEIKSLLPIEIYIKFKWNAEEKRIDPPRIYAVENQELSREKLKLVPQKQEEAEKLQGTIPHYHSLLQERDSLIQLLDSLQQKPKENLGKSNRKWKKEELKSPRFPWKKNNNLL